MLFDYQPGRGRGGPSELLKDFKGHLQTDGYAAYNIFDQQKDVTLLHCMAVCLEVVIIGPHAVETMVVGPPQGMTGIPCKPPYGAFTRKAEVLSDREKAVENCQVGFNELNESESLESIDTSRTCRN